MYYGKLQGVRLEIMWISIYSNSTVSITNVMLKSTDTDRLLFPIIYPMSVKFRQACMQLQLFLVSNTSQINRLTIFWNIATNCDKKKHQNWDMALFSHFNGFTK